MSRKRSKLQNVGEVDDEVEASVETLDADMSDAQIEASVEVDASTDDEPTEEDQAAQDAAEEEALSNVSEGEQQKALNRERNAFLKDVGKIGEAFGAGKTSMIALALRVTEAAAVPTIAPKDAEMIYERFKKSADVKATMDETGVVPDAAVTERPAAFNDADSKKSQLSKLRTFIKVGNKLEHEGVDLVHRARTVHIGMLSKDRTTVMQGSTYSILVRVASAHLDAKNPRTPMTDDEIESYLSVEPKETTPADGLKKLLDALNSASAAKKGGKERAPIESEHLDRALQALRAAIGEQPGGDEHLAEMDAKARAKEAKEAVAAFKQALALPKPLPIAADPNNYSI